MDIQIIGFGVIGQGFVEVLLRKERFLKQRYGLDLKVVSISDITGTAVEGEGIDLRRALEVMRQTRGIINYPGARKMTGVEAIEAFEADAVLEVTPSNIQTGEPGLTHMLKAMGQGKHLVTSNKGPLALRFRALSDAAKKNGVEFGFEASVGGAMPIINLAKVNLAGDEILAIEGILNGTTNFVLSRMAKEESPLEIVLKEAREMGIAEADPSYDIEGIDTAAKLVILANALMGIDATYRDVKTQGIRKVTPEAVKLAKEDGYAIKLIGEVRNSHLEVAPRLVPVDHPLNVDGILNVALLQTDVAGDITVVGKGAGAIETNSAILSDIISIALKRGLG
ncbi:MAG: homoserine dehydrogenase [Euryarchaeota archaeon]|nr:homoserine dehydrogenase [Euryarchaeota archaeon]